VRDDQLLDWTGHFEDVEDLRVAEEQATAYWPNVLLTWPFTTQAFALVAILCRHLTELTRSRPTPPARTQSRRRGASRVSTAQRLRGQRLATNRRGSDPTRPRFRRPPDGGPGRPNSRGPFVARGRSASQLPTVPSDHLLVASETGGSSPGRTGTSEVDLAGGGAEELGVVAARPRGTRGLATDLRP
jgi:hypothetical protein